MKAYAIVTPDGWYTPYRTVDPNGPPKLYKTEQRAQMQVDSGCGTWKEEAAVVEIEWRYNL